MSDAAKFAETLTFLLSQDDVVTESPTVGSSGAELELVRDIVAASPHRLFTVSARAVKNHPDVRARPGQVDDALAAEIIYRVATENPDALHLWRYVPPGDRLARVHTSVRPYDKRGYADPQVDYWMGHLPEFAALPPHLQDLFWNKRKRTPDYNRSRALPFAMAFEEDGADTRAGYEKVIGLYGHGYPSFYRRATVNLMQHVAKGKAGVRSMTEVSADQRKEAWRETRKSIRELYHLAPGTTDPPKGIKHPVPNS